MGIIKNLPKYMVFNAEKYPKGKIEERDTLGRN